MVGLWMHSIPGEGVKKAVVKGIASIRRAANLGNKKAIQRLAGKKQQVEGL
jgi:hypothetical protein